MSATPLSPGQLAHRAAFEQFVIAEAAPFHQQFLGRLYERWHAFNRRFYDGILAPPYITFGSPRIPQALGTCATMSDWGGRLQICIRSTLVDGRHRLLRPGPAFLPGRMQFVDDVLLHEMIHQWQFEVRGDAEASYKGHGPVFAGECNRIGALLDLPPVRPAKQRGPQAALPSCASWPHNVRPAAYYEGALTRALRGGPEPAPRRRSVSPPVTTDASYLGPISARQWEALAAAAAAYDERKGEQNATTALQALAAAVSVDLAMMTTDG